MTGALTINTLWCHTNHDHAWSTRRQEGNASGTRIDFDVYLIPSEHETDNEADDSPPTCLIRGPNKFQSNTSQGDASPPIVESFVGLNTTRSIFWTSFDLEM